MTNHFPKQRESLVLERQTSEPISSDFLLLGEMQSEQSRLAGQTAELQRRLGEAELRSELDCKSAQQEASSAKSECEFLLRKMDLLTKEADSRKHEYERTIKELEQRNMEVGITSETL